MQVQLAILAQMGGAPGRWLLTPCGRSGGRRHPADCTRCGTRFRAGGISRAAGNPHLATESDALDAGGGGHWLRRSHRRGRREQRRYADAWRLRPRTAAPRKREARDGSGMLELSRPGRVHPGIAYQVAIAAAERRRSEGEGLDWRGWSNTGSRCAPKFRPIATGHGRGRAARRDRGGMAQAMHGREPNLALDGGRGAHRSTRQRRAMRGTVSPRTAWRVRGEELARATARVARQDSLRGALRTGRSAASAGRESMSFTRTRWSIAGCRDGVPVVPAERQVGVLEADTSELWWIPVPRGATWQGRAGRGEWCGWHVTLNEGWRWCRGAAGRLHDQEALAADSALDVAHLVALAGNHVLMRSPQRADVGAGESFVSTGSSTLTSATDLPSRSRACGAVQCAHAQRRMEGRRRWRGGRRRH